MNGKNNKMIGNNKLKMTLSILLGILTLIKKNKIFQNLEKIKFLWMSIIRIGRILILMNN